MLTRVAKRYFASGRFADRFSPAVLFYARSYDVDLGSVKASGPGGIILKGDVLGYIKQNNLKLAGLHSKKEKEAPKQAKTKSEAVSFESFARH